MATEHTTRDERFSSRKAPVAALYEAIQAIEGDGSFAAEGDLGEVNPGLEIEGLGLIGLPISPHDVDRLCEAGVSGPGGRHYVDSSKIKFLHPRWSEREDIAIRTVCEQLGVPGGATHVIARFSCITIEAAGTISEICEPTESERFGTLQICLPSLHAGGDITVRANDTTITQNTDARCWWNCSYQAHFSDTFKTIDPICSGQRITLCYDLICTNSAVTPSSSSLSSQLATLKTALRNWNDSLEGSSDVPSMLAYALLETYKVNQGISNFAGLDFRRSKCIQRILSECDFSCFIAHIEREVEGFCSGETEEAGIASESEGEQSEASNDVQEPDNAIVKVHSRSLKITDLSELDGSSLICDVSLERSNIMQKRLFDRAPDHEETEEQLNFMDELEAEIATHHWSNTALLLMPRRLAMSFCVGHLRKFENGDLLSFYDAARRQAQDLIRYVTSNVQKYPDDTQCRLDVETLCDALIGANQRVEEARKQEANRGGHTFLRYGPPLYDSMTVALAAKSYLIIRDLCRFESALRSNGHDLHGSKVLSPDLLMDVLEASNSFSFSQLEPSFEVIVQLCSGTEELIETISTLTKSYKPESNVDQAAVIRWRRAAIGAMFAAIDEKPKDVVPALTECIAWDCENEWLEERAMPLVQANARRPWFTLAFLNALFQAGYHEILDCELVNQAFGTCAPTVIEGFVFPTQCPKNPNIHGHKPKAEFRVSVSPQPGICGYELMKFHRKLVKFGLSDLVRALLHKIAEKSDAPGAVEYFRSAILLYVHDALSSPESGALLADEECKNSLKTIIRNYLMSLVGSPVPKPTTWSQLPLGCGICAECRDLDLFLQDPSRCMIGFKRSREIREHLENRLRPRVSGLFSNLQLRTRSDRPNKSLVIEKTMKGWNTWYEDWNFRVREAHDWFHRANLPGDVREYALQLLGEVTKVDMSSFYQGPYPQTGSNPQGQITNVQKRGLEEQDENVPPAKRQAEVIDLSESP